MSVYMRAVLMLGAVFNFIFVCFKLRKSQLKFTSAFFWIFFSVTLLILGVFPQIGIFFAVRLGVLSSVNFIFLVVIALLVLRSFLLTIRVSELENKLDELVEELAVGKLQESEDSQDSVYGIGETML